MTYVLLLLAAADSLLLALVLDGNSSTDDGGGDVVAASEQVAQVKVAEEATDGLVGSLGVAALDGVAVAADIANRGAGALVVVLPVGGNGDGDGNDGSEDGGSVHFEGLK